nr:hypothetical protein [Candidatus Sigynarchaeum springense]
MEMDDGEFLLTPENRHLFINRRWTDTGSTLFPYTSKAFKSKY